jgi:formylglycine-generating enzyme required for sulfatase activity
VDYNSTAYPATVSDFYLDKYEITVGRFRQFVDTGMGTQAKPPAAGAGLHPLIANSGWNSAWNTILSASTASLKSGLKCEPDWRTWTDQAGANENRPINCSDWYTAFAFCAWDGGRLATDAEWNFAASGGSEQRYYPWSNPATSTTISPSYASYWPDDTQQCMGDGVVGCTVADFVVVGSKPNGNGRWGHADLAGNVAEWTLDWNALFANPCINCANLTPTTFRSMWGGHFGMPTSGIVAAARNSYPPDVRQPSLGIRCARTSL